MAAPMASTGAHIRNLRRTRCSCARPRATHAAQRMSSSASGMTPGPADALVTGLSVSALVICFSQSEEPPNSGGNGSLCRRFTVPRCAIEDSMP